VVLGLHGTRGTATTAGGDCGALLRLRLLLLAAAQDDTKTALLGPFLSGVIVTGVPQAQIAALLLAAAAADAQARIEPALPPDQNARKSTPKI
jgi:hypothetical protein